MVEILLEAMINILVTLLMFSMVVYCYLILKLWNVLRMPEELRKIIIEAKLKKLQEKE
tara:strand:- start:1004 stop:1177 length:174 start_codon:yes stop_codon:yes gene_type:complete